MEASTPEVPVHPGPTEAPVVGQVVNIPVVSSSTRLTLFPGNAVVLASDPAANGPQTLELIFLMQEAVMLAQTGRVVSAEGGLVNVELGQAIIGSQLSDVGHVRLLTDVAVEMAISILEHAIRRHDRKRSDLADRLRAEPTDIT